MTDNESQKPGIVKTHTVTHLCNENGYCESCKMFFHLSQLNSESQKPKRGVLVYIGGKGLSLRNVKVGTPTAPPSPTKSLKALIQAAIFYARMGGVRDAITNHDWQFKFSEDEVIKRTLAEDLQHVQDVLGKTNEDELREAFEAARQINSSDEGTNSYKFDTFEDFLASRKGEI